MFGSKKPDFEFSVSVAAVIRVTDIGEPSCGLRKRTPSSVTWASLSNETI